MVSFGGSDIDSFFPCRSDVLSLYLCDPPIDDPRFSPGPLPSLAFSSNLSRRGRRSSQKHLTAALTPGVILLILF